MDAMVAKTLSATERVGWLTLNRMEECRRDLHKKAFRVRHGLAGNPLFTIERLIEVAKSAAQRPGDIYVDAGNVAIEDKWGDIPVPSRSVDEIISRIENAGAWIVMKHTEQNPAYAAVLSEWVAFVREIAGPEQAKLLLNPEMLVFITSPKRVTPFHFDAEVNFLVQIAGTKDLWVCDPEDRTIVTEREREKYYGETIAAADYKPDAEPKATHFVLKPGDAVHIPTHGAHWVKNHDNISVSLSLNFEFPNWLMGDVHRVNRKLRQYGLNPKPVGQSLATDRIKGVTYNSIRKLAKATIRRPA